MGSWLELWQRHPDPWRILLPMFLLANVWTAALYALARRMPQSRYAWLRALAWLPGIRQRDVHTSTRPRVGGVAMWLAIVLGFCALLSWQPTASWLHFSQEVRYGSATATWGIIAGMLVLLVVGVWDDLRSLPPLALLLSQIAAALCLVFSGIGVQYIRLPNDGALYLDRLSFSLPAWLGGQSVWLWSALFTLIWVVLMINVMNFFDGLDGLTGSVAITSAWMLFFVSMRGGFVATATLALLVVGATAGFLPWNWHPSKLFMGTVGSQTLGFLLAIIAIISGGKVATAVLVLGIPIFDAMVVIIRRIIAKQSPFKADQRHLHHRLLKAGLSVPEVVILLNVVALLFGVLAVRTQDSTLKGWLTLAVAGCMGIFIALTYYLEQRVIRREG